MPYAALRLGAPGPHKGKEARVKLMKDAQAKMVASKNRKLIESLKYIKENMPQPQFPGSSTSCDHEWPKKVALTGGRKLKAIEVEDLTLRIITSRCNGKPVGIHAFAKRLRPYLPPSVLLNPNWFDNQDRLQDQAAQDAINDFRAWFVDYMNIVESELLRFYMHKGEKFGKQYLTVLERLFRENWSPNFKLEAKSEVEAKVNGEVEHSGTVEHAVSFVFETVVPEGSDAKKE